MCNIVHSEMDKDFLSLKAGDDEVPQKKSSQRKLKNASLYDSLTPTTYLSLN